ncbi:serine hydrolase domain-containing protein [Sphingomonas sp.]|uniref:serine hydrolase domain-containing protein n=1 Tax=Sphingomonas sp. TaxID=28214 RepID=UPI0025E7D805|nr:serine hydrolase domain-containing protein [Sphingomonas sp.]MBV9527130.1 beta-lactamase family protein [Sphingomonas sp.]
MILTRRQFGAGAFAATAAPRLAAASALPQGAAPFAAAIDSIRAYGARHLAYYGLPGLTLGLIAPGGFATVLNFGFADRTPPRTIGPDTLFQVGSITKVMTAAIIHQLMGEGRLRLTDRVSALAPSVPLPDPNLISVQDLLDHVGGLASDAPVDPPGGLWTGFAPGTHWHYSNTGYEILGMVAEQASGEPLARLFEKRLFTPVGMTRSRGAILQRDQALYAQGYRAADPVPPFARGVPLAPAPWIDATSGALSVASTASDMVRFLRTLSDAASGRGGLGLSPAAGAELTRHAVTSDTPAMSYGNGLMHVGNAGRAYLHHTGGMVSFSSSFHLDKASGSGAFACSNISAFAEYRPRLLTLFATDALTAAMAGRPIPPAPALTVPVAGAGAYIGLYAGPSGGFEVRAGEPLTIVANGRAAALQPWGGELFRTTHPDFRDFSLMFERRGAAIGGASWGAESFTRAGLPPALVQPDPALAPLAGSFVNDSSWWGTLRVVQRNGSLWLGTETPLSRIDGHLWRVGSDAWSPERALFADIADGRPRTLIYSGVPFTRRDG